jgi:chromosomal replication initiation ATPase DnaA
VDTDQVLRMFSESKTRSRRKYREFMAEKDGFERKEVYDTIDQRLKGDDDFVDRILEQHAKESVTKLRRPALEAISKIVEKKYGVSPADLRSPSKTKTLTIARRVLSIVASEEGYKAVEIGRYLEKEPTIVTFSLRDKNTVEEEVQTAKRAIKSITALKV